LSSRALRWYARWSASPSPQNYKASGWYTDMTPRARGLFDYDDLFARTVTYLRMYRAAANGSGFTTNGYDGGTASPYTGTLLQAWAANVWMGYHDEVLIRSTNEGFHFVEGQRREPGQAFVFGSTAWHTRTEWDPLIDSIEVALGDFSGDFRADILISAPTSAGVGGVGTKLWLGGQTSVQPGTFYRSDLTPSTTATAVADFIRAGYDDVMFTTASGSYLAAGVGGGTFTQYAWTGAYPSSSWVWFGRE
jgi:hypothetical protein